MNIVVWGASPLAGWLAAHLSQTNHVVTWLATRPVAEAITDSRVLQVVKGQSALTVNNLRIVTQAAECLRPPLHWIIFAMPGWAVNDAVMAITRYIPPTHYPPILLLQAGVGVIEKIEGMLGEGCAVYGIHSGEFQWGSKEGDSIPDYTHPSYDGKGGFILEAHTRRQEILSILKDTGSVSAAPAARVSLAWSYVFWKMQANALPTLLDITPQAIYQNERLFSIEVAQTTEALHVIRRLNIKLVALPEVNVPRLAAQLRWLPRRWRPRVLKKYIKTPALRHDLITETGRSDAAYFNGAVAIAAHRLGLPAPVNQALALALTDVAEGRMRWSQFQNNPDYLETFIRITGRHQSGSSRLPRKNN